MNKTISINLGGRNFFIEEDAYAKLDAYLKGIKAHFSGYHGSEEIVSDMESRIAEKFVDKYQNDTQAVITVKDVENLIVELGSVEDIAGEEGKSNHQKSTNNNYAPKRLMRNGDDKIIAGVCSGLGAYFDVDPIIFRGIFGILIFAWGAIVPIYFVLWIIMPEAKTATQKMEMRGLAFNLDSIGQTIRQRSREFKDHITDPKVHEEWKKWGEDMKHWDKKKESMTEANTKSENFSASMAEPMPTQPVEPVYHEQVVQRSMVGSFFRQIFQGLGKIIVFIVKFIRRFLGIILIFSFGIAIASVTLAFATAIFNANSPYLGLPLASIPHNFVFYLLLTTAYLIVLFPLQLLLLTAVSIFSAGRSGMNVGAGVSLFVLWVCALVIGGAVGARYVPQYIEQIKNSPQLQTVSKTYDAKDFSSLNLSNSVTYKLVQGKEFKVEATGWQMDLDRLNVKIDNGTLNIYKGTKAPCVFCFSGHPNVTITAPDFASIKAMNSSSVSADSIVATSTSLTLSNSSSAKIEYHVKDLTLKLSNSSSANLFGEAVTLTGELHNSSDLNAEELIVKDADITTSNSSSAHVNVSGSLSYTIFNSSNIYYLGQPKIVAKPGASYFQHLPIPQLPASPDY